MSQESVEQLENILRTHINTKYKETLHKSLKLLN